MYKAEKRATTKQCTLMPLILAIVSDPNGKTNKIYNVVATPAL